MKNVQILLSTFNGEKFLAQQLNSIVNLLNFHNIKLLIRDDGSTDSTIKILHKYEEKYNFTIIYGQNIGIVKSMEKLIKSADTTCEYYCFCDQDDVWLSKKISAAISKINNAIIPTLYACRCELVDAKLEHMGYTPIPKQTSNFYNAGIENLFPGHTMVFNKALFNILLKTDLSHCIMHDWWVYLLATAFGKVIYDKEIYVKYRQHNNNVVGYELGLWKQFITRLKRLNSGNTNAVGLQLQSFYHQLNGQLKPEYSQAIEDVFINETGFFYRLLHLHKIPFIRDKKGETILFLIMYLFGKYKT